MISRSKRFFRCISIAGLLGSLTPLVAQSPTPTPATDTMILPSLTVIGSKENVARLPGSGVFIDTSDIRTLALDDINQVVRRTPGIYMRQEDGFGLFPNLSLRGVSTTRNGKITIMEDGILMAPAPYSDPSAYYTPNVGRMSGLEILKGSSQVKYGPETTGGIINYLSTPIPSNTGGSLSASVGTDRDLRLHATYGGKFKAAWATVGVLLENVYRENGGFKTIDAAAGGGYAGSDQTGFRRNEPLAKLRFDFAGSVAQSLELSYGQTDLTADETYLGLTDADFRANPFRRYAASRFDKIVTEQERLALRYAIRPTGALALRVVAYQTDFARNWYKLDGAGVGATGGFLNPAEALAGQHGPVIVDVLRGGAAGRLRVRANNRVYGAKGIESVATWDFTTAAVTHRLEVGARFHRDFADRFQWDDTFAQAANGSANLLSAGVAGTQENRRAESDALALYVHDRIAAGRLTLTPGIRFERIDYTDIRRSTALTTLSQETSRSSRSIDYFAPGLGLTWAQSDDLTWLAGVHRGISPPGPGSVTGGIGKETSLGFEAGLRHRHGRDFSAEVVFFHTAFKDLIVEQNAGGGGGAGQTSNIGQVDSTGMEISATYDPARSRGWKLSNPWHLAVTWTHARLANDVNAVGNSGSVAESIFSGGRAGNKLPYIPEFQIALGTAVEFDRWSLHLDTFFQPRTWASANNAAALINPDASAAAGLQPAADSRYGRVDAFLLVDAGIHYRISPRTRLKLTGSNLLGWDYIASRVPIGPRPGPPRSFLFGCETRF